MKGGVGWSHGRKERTSPARTSCGIVARITFSNHQHMQEIRRRGAKKRDTQGQGVYRLILSWSGTGIHASKPHKPRDGSCAEDLSALTIEVSFSAQTVVGVLRQLP